MARAGRTVRERWNDYWFASEPVIGLAIFRICFGASALLYHLPRLPRIPELYTRAGFLFPAQPAPWLQAIAPVPLPLAYLLNGALILCLAAIVLGYRTRLAAFLGFGIHTHLVLLERFATNSIPQAIAIYLLLLALSPAGAYFSWEAWRKTGSWAPRAVPRAPATLRRLMVWQLASMYISNSLLKLVYGLRDWLGGDIVVWALHDVTWSQLWVRSFIPRVEFPLRVAAAHGFLGYLFLGPALLWKRTAAFAIVFGLSWHLVTLLTTTVSPAWLAWVSIFILVLDPRWWERHWNLFRGRQISLWRLVLASSVVIAFVFAAVTGR